MHVLLVLAAFICGCASGAAGPLERGKEQNVLFYSDRGAQGKVACVSVQTVVRDSLAGKEARDILERFLGEKEAALAEILGRVEEPTVLSKLIEDINRFETLDYESREGETEKPKANYGELYQRFREELKERPERPEEVRLWEVKRDYLQFYDQLRSELTNLDFELKREGFAEILDVVSTMGRRRNLRKIVDSPASTPDESCLDDITPLVVKRCDARLRRGRGDFRFFFQAPEEIWPTLIGYLNNHHYGVRQADRDRGIVVTETTYVDVRGEERVRSMEQPLAEAKEDGEIARYIDRVAIKPPLTGGVWFVVKETVRIEMVPVAESVTKVKVKLFIEACNSDHGWYTLKSKRRLENSILEGFQKRLES
jgi:hypothetical protein